MVDSSTILKAAALPMSHTPTGVLKVEILGGLLFLGWCISTIGFHRWYKIYREDAILKDTKDELIEQRQDLLESIKDDTLTEDQKWALVDKKIPFSEEDYEPPLRSHFLNYLVLFGGLAIIVGGVVTWLVIPA